LNTAHLDSKTFAVQFCTLLFHSVLFWTDGRTDGHDEALLNFANPCNNYFTSLVNVLTLFELRLNWTGHPWWWVSQLEITEFYVAGATMRVR